MSYVTHQKMKKIQVIEAEKGQSSNANVVKCITNQQPLQSGLNVLECFCSVNVEFYITTNQEGLQPELTEQAGAKGRMLTLELAFKANSSFLYRNTEVIS